MKRRSIPTLFGSRESYGRMHRPRQPVLILLAVSLLAVGDATAKSTVKPKPVRAALEAPLHGAAECLFRARFGGRPLRPISEHVQHHGVGRHRRSRCGARLHARVLRAGREHARARLEAGRHRPPRRHGGGRTGPALDVASSRAERSAPWRRAQQRETWIRERDEWFLWRVDHIRPGEWRVDGKRIDPSKPYDPSAPEYRPPPK